MTKQVHAPGVLVSHELGADCFTGTAEDLVAAGLVRMEQLPGQPGNGTTTVSFRADGTRVRKGTPGGVQSRGLSPDPQGEPPADLRRAWYR